MKILFLSANPSSTERLALDQEARDIKEGLMLMSRGRSVSIETEWAVRPRDIRRAMERHRPNIVHFAVHGSGEHGIVVETAEGDHALIGSEALGQLFELFSDCVKCVVLNACYSEKQVEPIARHIECVVGMKYAVYDRAAIEFAVAFYDAIAAGREFAWAFKLAKNAVALSSLESEFEAVFVGTSPSDKATGQISPALHELFVMWTISGLLKDDAEKHAYLLSAFASLIRNAGRLSPSEEMLAWLEDAKRRASEATGLPKAMFTHQDFNVEIKAESLGVEESFFRLWRAACGTSDPSMMVIVRTALISHVGEERQAELIADWNRRV